MKGYGTARCVPTGLCTQVVPCDADSYSLSIMFLYSRPAIMAPIIGPIQ